jgi:hypothetical protein
MALPHFDGVGEGWFYLHGQPPRPYATKVGQDSGSRSFGEPPVTRFRHARGECVAFLFLPLLFGLFELGNGVETPPPFLVRDGLGEQIGGTAALQFLGRSEHELNSRIGYTVLRVECETVEIVAYEQTRPMCRHDVYRPSIDGSMLYRRADAAKNWIDP